MKQSKLESFMEALVNTMIGFCVTMSVYPIINWICGIEMSMGQASLSTLLFTIISILRGYIIRRFFNNLAAVKIAIHNFLNSFYNVKGKHNESR